MEGDRLVVVVARLQLVAIQVAHDVMHRHLIAPLGHLALTFFLTDDVKASLGRRLSDAVRLDVFLNLLVFQHRHAVSFGLFLGFESSLLLVVGFLVHHAVHLQADDQRHVGMDELFVAGAVERQGGRDHETHRAAFGHHAQGLIEALADELLAVLHLNGFNTEGIHDGVTLWAAHREVEIDIVAHLGELAFSRDLHDDKPRFGEGISTLSQRCQEGFFLLFEAVHQHLAFCFKFFERLDGKELQVIVNRLPDILCRHLFHA